MGLRPRERRLRRLRRLLLRLALGKRDFEYMAMTLRQDPRLRRCKLADIVVRQDGMERRIEADWLKRLARIVYGEEPIPEPPVPQPDGHVYICHTCNRRSRSESEHLGHTCSEASARVA